VQTTFTKKRRFLKGVNWGWLYNEFKNKVFDPRAIEEENAMLMMDDDVTKKSGISLHSYQKGKIPFDKIIY